MIKSFDRKSLRHWIREQRGSITVEATLTIPIVMLVLIIFLFSFVYFYERADVLKQAHAAASRTSEQWSVTHRSDELSQQGLYWRWGEGSVVSWLDIGDRKERYTLSLPLATEEGYSRIQHKLARTATDLSPHLGGKLQYEAQLFFPRIEVQLQSAFEFPRFFQIGMATVGATGHSWVTEPTEWIRNLDFIRTYGTMLKDRMMSKEQATQTIVKFLELNRPVTFDRHDPAAVYLQKLVSGKAQKFQLANGRHRFIDAFTDNGIAHSAFLTFNEKNLREQMQKDVELIQKGTEVQGAVWHFFKRHDQRGRVGPSDKLLKELKENGIVVVIHD